MQQLEQTLEMYQTGISRQQPPKTYFVVGNLEYLSASALYSSGPLGGSGPLNARIIPMRIGAIIPYGNFRIPELKDVHETFKIDKEGNISFDHFSFTPKKGKKLRIFNDDQ